MIPGAITNVRCVRLGLRASGVTHVPHNSFAITILAAGY